MCTYEHLVEVTLAHGRIPLVVPQLRTITLGGAVSGLGIESTSFRNGLPHESVLEMDVMTGSGEIVSTKPGDALFDAFPNSYGSLGYATRLRIELEPVPAVRRAPARPLRRRHVAGGRRRAGRRRGRVGRGAGRRAGRGRVLSRRALPHARPVDRRTRRDVRLHRAAGVLPLAPAPRDRPADHARLPVALGHRLVLVLTGLRGPAPARPAGVATSVASVRRLLASGRTRSSPRHRRPAGPARRTAAGGARGPGRRSARSTDSPSSSTGSTVRWACARCGCAPCDCDAAGASGRGPATR